MHLAATKKERKKERKEERKKGDSDADGTFLANYPIARTPTMPLRTSSHRSMHMSAADMYETRNLRLLFRHFIE